MGGGRSRPPPPPPPDPEVGRLRNERDGYNRQRDNINNAYNNYTNIHWRSNFDNEQILKARAQEQAIADAKAEIAREQAKNLKTTTFNNTVNEINKDLNSHIDKKNSFFNSQNATVFKTLTVFMNKTRAQMNDLITDISNQNIQIEKQIQQNKANDNSQKYINYEYLNIEINKLKEKNKILWYTFYVLLIIAGIIIFLNNRFNNRIQVILFILLILYPFYIYYLELLIYNIFVYLKKVIELTPFHNTYLNL
jgi:cytochrome c-type biogenesis protein CcmH/NrfF